MARRKYKREGKGIAAIVLPQLRSTAHYAVDRATSFAKERTRQRIQAAGLGRLAGAVGSQSSLRNRRLGRGVATGVIFARGSTQSRANQTLLAYSEGAAIFPSPGKKWLAFPTKSIPTRVGREKMTPALYRSSGLVQSIGRLHYVPGKSGRIAYLVARKVTVSRRTGRAKAFSGKVPRGADRADSVVAFVLIRFTRRAQRFNQRAIMLEASAKVPEFAADYTGRAKGG